MDLPTLPPTASQAVTTLLGDLGLRADDPRAAVHVDDEMLAFLRDVYDGDPEQALASYYISGRNIAAVMTQVLRWRSGDTSPAASVLDFASGYGRVTRFLLDVLRPDQLTVADILPGAVEFQRRAFGVTATLSTTDPAELDLGRRFDAVLVTSLFTHLPEARFERWLAALVDRLQPGGVLAFTTHDIALLPTPTAAGAQFHFQRTSEIPTLDIEEYGTTWVSETYLRSCLRGLDRRLEARRFPRAICNFQDLWVVTNGDAAPGELALREEPEICFERCEFRGPRCELVGWAVSRYGDVQRLELVLPHDVVSCPVDLPRPDARQVTGTASDLAGWRAEFSLPPGISPHDVPLLVRAVDSRGNRYPLFAGRLAALQLAARKVQLQALQGAHHSFEQNARHQLSALHGRIAAMEASRFWKLRQAYFSVKGSLARLLAG